MTIPEIEKFLSEDREKKFKELLQLFKTIPANFDKGNTSTEPVIPLEAFTFHDTDKDVNIKYKYVGYASSLTCFRNLREVDMCNYHVPVDDVNCTLTEIYRNRCIFIKYKCLLIEKKYNIQLIGPLQKGADQVIYYIPDDLIEDLLDYSLKLTDEAIHDKMIDTFGIRAVDLFKQSQKY